MAFDYSKLLGRIKEKYGTQEKFAQAIGTSGTVLSRKLNNGSSFNQEEIVKATELLGIDDNEFKTIFFTKKVHISEQTKAS
ncbi:MAG: DUF739 family protein [Lactococcus lactis]